MSEFTRNIPKQQRSKTMLENILRVSAERLSEVGEFGFSVSYVAAQLKVSSGIVYRYFQDRESLIRAAIKHGEPIVAETVKGNLLRDLRMIEQMGARPAAELLGELSEMIGSASARNYSRG